MSTWTLWAGNGAAGHIEAYSPEEARTAAEQAGHEVLAVLDGNMVVIAGHPALAPYAARHVPRPTLYKQAIITAFGYDPDDMTEMTQIITALDPAARIAVGNLLDLVGPAGREAVEEAVTGAFRAGQELGEA